LPCCLHFQADKMNSERLYERYERQILLQELGMAGQQKLLQAKVLVIGAGGLGCPVLQYLAAAGVGTIGIVDDDVVALNNLHRQVLFTVNDIGLSKAVIAKEKLQLLNPEIKIIAYNERLTVANALGIIEKYDVVIDGTDNFSTRYLINDACVLLDKRLVFGAISKFEGQLAIFNCRLQANEISVNYRDLFPQPPKDGEVLNCSETGVLGVLPGIIGTMMANETIKLITGIGIPLINRMLTYHALTNRVYELALQAREQTPFLIPNNIEAFQKMNYEWLCASTSAMQFEIDAARFDDLIRSVDTGIIDVRERDEKPAITEFDCIQIPLPQLKDNLTNLKASTLIVFCQSGKRSLQAAQCLFDEFGATKKIYSLQGGILSWKKINKKQWT
jgi:molybdopterin/thiamine biosynthesis adenylyltransferase/rhodanese-related sulfurtransferase